MHENEKLKKAARKICTSDCIARYDCGKSKSAYRPLLSLTQNEECPLMCYEIEHEDKPKDFLEIMKNQLTLGETFLLCQYCKHRDTSQDTEDTISTDSCFYTHCMDCPVLMAQECINECMAEAAMS